MSYGYFDPQNREYIITDACTPVKWINYIGTRNFGGFVDHTGGALICKDDPTYNRITRYIQQAPSSDFKGETLYIRLKEENGYSVFSPFFVPGLDKLERFECHIGTGYTRILSEFKGIKTDVRIFVPLEDGVEIRDIRVENTGQVAQTIDLIPVVEYSHPNALMQFSNADWIPQTMQSRCVTDGEYTILLQYPFMNRNLRMNYFTSNRVVSSFETDRKNFLGRNEYGTMRLPLSLLEKELSNTQAQRGDNVAVLLHPCGELQPGESCRLVTQLGQTDTLANCRRLAEKYRMLENVDRAYSAIITFWDAYLATLQVETPDKDMDILLNIHNPYQCYITKTWSRYLSYYQPGLGSRGIGFRDSSQDVMAVCASLPQEVRNFNSTLMSFQKRDGSAMHQFNPLTMQASNGDAWEIPDRPQYYGDDHLWSVLAVTAYLKESGDFAYLDEQVPFYRQGDEEQPIESASVLEHVLRAVDFTRNNVGKHGLPLLGFADWNDTVNLASGSESVFIAGLYGRALLDVIRLLEVTDRQVRAEEYRKAYQEMKTRFEAATWDGNWYIRYFDEIGNPLGSARNRYGQIYLNAQSWAVLSGFASESHARQAMNSAYQYLNTSCGIKLSTPGFDGYDAKYGGVTTYPPGAKENGGIFLHPNPWAMMAEAMLGNGERAYRYYTQINPVTKNQDIDHYECEPYVYAQNILGDEHPQFGLARNSWLSGTASWCYQAATQWILGIRPEYEGLRIDPCIPSEWDGFSATRTFRDRKVHIHVYNPAHVSKGVSHMLVNHKQVKGNLLELCKDCGEYHVEVWLG